jgi:hypothetical protein
MPRFRELIDAVQWFPGLEHRNLSTSVLESGISPDLHEAIAHEVRAGNGQVAVIRAYDDHDCPGWFLVRPGDWVVTRGGRDEVMTDDEFKRAFEPVG